MKVVKVPFKFRPNSRLATSAANQSTSSGGAANPTHSLVHSFIDMSSNGIRKGGDLESGGIQNESTPLMKAGQGHLVINTGKAPNEIRNPSPDSAWMEPDFEPKWFDKFLPYIRDKPFSYKLTNNFAAGMTVALINIPLSLSLAVASATTPQCGMITAIYAGFFSAIFGGSHYNIMGPTGALSGILARYAILWGPQCLPILSITSGIVMLLVFMMNWDKYVTFLPSAVAHGFTLGVAAIIAGGQLGAAFSLPPIPASPHFLENMQNYLNELIAGLADFRAFGVFFVMWMSLFLLVKKFPKFPWMVPIAGLGVFIGWLSTNGYIFPLKTLRDKYGELSLVLFDPPAYDPNVLADWGDLVTASLSIAFVGVLESLISGKIADGLTRSTMNQRQEVFAVAAANLSSGLAGGLPATAALARTALNIRSGANSRLAGVLNGFLTLLMGLVLLPTFGYLPLCVVASLLFQVATGMIETKHLIHSFHIDRGSFWLTLFVAGACLVFDPTAAIVLGAIGGLLRFAEAVATGYSEVTLTRDLQNGTKLDLQYFDAHHHARVKEGMIIALWQRMFGRPTSPILDVKHDQVTHVKQRGMITEFEHHTIIYRIVGDLTYISALHHMARLRRMDSSKHLIISFRYCFYVDLDGLDSLEECLTELAANKPNRYILLSSFGKQGIIWSLLNKCNWFTHGWLDTGLVFDSVDEASKFLKERNGGSEGPSPKTTPHTAINYQSQAESKDDLAEIRASSQRKLSMDSVMG